MRWYAHAWCPSTAIKVDYIYVSQRTFVHMCSVNIGKLQALFEAHTYQFSEHRRAHDITYITPSSWSFSKAHMHVHTISFSCMACDAFIGGKHHIHITHDVTSISCTAVALLVYVLHTHTRSYVFCKLNSMIKKIETKLGTRTYAAACALKYE